MKHPIASTLVLVTLALRTLAFGQAAVDPDPNGVLLKPIPDRLIVLTFDDGPASHATVVAPVLKEMGFGGSFYVCDFDSFKTRKDWYLTWRQMIAMDADGFEIGNHTVGHGGSLENFVRMEEELFANHGPRMTTVCWPLYAVSWTICPDLAANGYTFGRGGHERPYRPTVDNPFDVPSFTITDGVPVERFIKQAQMACQGRVVVYCFHGVPDMEHPGVSLEPATFKAMMRYLKDNNYQVIAMRDLDKYIDPAKAAKLPPTVNDAKGSPPFESLKDDKPFVAPPANGILEFSFPGLPAPNMSKTHIRQTVPYATDLTALAPDIKLAADATLTPASGTARDFSNPQSYTVTGPDGSTKTYVVTVNRTPINQDKEMLTFTLPGALSTALSSNRIRVVVPKAMDVTTVAPAFTLSPFATVVPASGTARDFTQPQAYTITAQDGSSRIVSVAVARSDKSNHFIWNKPEGGNWSDSAQWSNHPTGGGAPAMTGQPDGILTFNPGAPCTVRNDLKEGFLLNQLVLGDRSGGLIVSGNGLTFTREGSNNNLPVIHAGKCQRVDINTPVILQDDLTVNTSAEKDPNCFISFNAVIAGPHALILNSSGDPNVPGINFHDVHFGILQLNNANTYSGGTLIDGGKINVRKTGGLGSGTITLDHFGTLTAESTLANPVIINQGTLFHCALSGPMQLNGIANFIGNCMLSGDMTGPGGFTMLGTNGTYLNMVPGGTVTLAGANSYTGPTTVFPGTLIVKKAAGLYHGNTAKWTPENITIHKAATLRLNVGGPGEFTGAQVGTLLENLTTAARGNGLMGGSFLSLDTANATEPITVSASIADSQGPGGGAFLFRKCGAGGMRLSGKNTYTGQTVLEGGTLSVDSLNSFTQGKGRAGSSLGAPTNIETGEIVLGEEAKDGDCALIYTGPGETTDRVMNLAGKTLTVTVSQSGGGLLKFTSPLLISGYGGYKTIVLSGDTAGTGELAGAIIDPHDRAGKAATAITKSGKGSWTLSGTNPYTGPTKVAGGVLVCTTAASLGCGALDISSGAKVQLNYSGTRKIAALTLHGGPALPPGTYGSATSPAAHKDGASFTGTGTVTVAP
jgi:autotransporter-associated beta strand protein